MSRQTNLILRGALWPPFSCRDAEQTLCPIQTGELRRTINGELCYLGSSGHHKYRTTIRCQDHTVPAMQHLWVGAEIEVACIARIWETHTDRADGVITLSRNAVRTTLEVLKNRGHPIPYEWQNENTIVIPQAHQQTVLVGYAPILHMRLVNFHYLEKEWAAQDFTTWQLDLEEI